jgi:TfoX/Sxy family transcriptional regulator of competence genes
MGYAPAQQSITPGTGRGMLGAMAHQGGPRSSKSDPETQTAFRRLVPDDERVTTRPMFGSLAAFANGYMFMGLFGPDLFVRLLEADRQAQLEAGWQRLEVMPGKAMGDYLVLPDDWRMQPDLVRNWGERALEYVTSLPPKR